MHGHMNVKYPFTLLYIVVITSLFHVICSLMHFHTLHLLQSVHAHRHVCLYYYKNNQDPIPSHPTSDPPKFPVTQPHVHAITSAASQ